MGLVTVLVFAFGLAVASGGKCRDISGTWQNQLGSRLVLNVDASNRISGEFYTAVERNPGDAALASNVTGLFSKQKDGSLLAFTVLFNHGSSLASWVGQCLVCDDKEELYTTYSLRRHVSDPQQKWGSTTVGQDTFWRYQDSATAEHPPTKTQTVVLENHSGGQDLTGKWKSQDDSELHLEIFGSTGSVLEGKFSKLDVIGRKDGNNAFTAVTLMTMKDQTIRSLTGYINNDFSSSPQILEMTGLAHEFSSDCQRPRNVKFESHNFARMAPKSEKLVIKSETFIDKIRKFFSSMF